MEQYGLIGYPLGHSFSRRFFNEEFFPEHHIEAEYLNFEIEKAELLLDVVKGHPMLRGLNCTIPHKQAIIPLLDSISPEAEEIGAVNVIRIREGHMKGFNSDIIGFMDSIRPLLKSHHRRALVLGSGGASKAIWAGLKRLGIEPTQVSRRSGGNALTYGDLTQEVMAEHEVIVNCSPVGMFPHVDECPDIPYDMLTTRHLLYDLVYNPTETLFMKKGSSAGATVKNGLEMLRLQALASWNFWNTDDDE
jgi:shikimate dehydrogenase